jgi:hypothetical protein
MHAKNYTQVMRTISLRLPNDLFAKLTKTAKVRGVTRSAVVRESLESALYDQASAGAVSCYDLSRDLAGTVKGMPKDLAHNSKYMRGFGYEPHSSRI